MGENDLAKKEALGVLGRVNKLPRLLVFDLDYTLWKGLCEGLPQGENPTLHADVKGILEALKERGVTMAVASRSLNRVKAVNCLDRLGLVDYFADIQIFPTEKSGKVEHFETIQVNTKILPRNKTGIPYKEMLFFDDLPVNIKYVSPMGVTCILVKHGVNLSALSDGISKHAGSSTST